MVSVKLLKPYFIKVNEEYIRIILAYQYFTIAINGEVYNFIPIEGHEILINRKTKRIVNTDTKFAFQKEEKVIYLTLKKLTTLKDFMSLIDQMIEPYSEEMEVEKAEAIEKVNELVTFLERENIKRLIDDSLDNGNMDSFQHYVGLLKHYDHHNQEVADRTD